LTQPVAEFISANHSGRIKPEHTHPTFATLSPGRPKQVDFALLTKNKESIETVIECKWASDSAMPKQAIVDDILRLECYRDPDRQVSRYFLVAGSQEHFEANFRDLKYRDGSDQPFTKLLLSFDRRNPRSTLDVFGSSGGFRKYFRSFNDEYRQAVPKTVDTELVSSTTADKICVFMWRVNSAKNRKAFDAELPSW